MSQGSNRRDFLKYTAATGMGYWVASRKTWAQEAERRGPNERVNIACIGLGGKGDSDSEQAADVGNIVAICDVDDNQVRRKAEYKTKDGKTPFAKARQYYDYRKMIDEMGKEIDGVTVSICDHNHAEAAMLAMKAGKGVYCQKPLAHSVGEARSLRLAADKYKVATQMGNQGTAEDGLREAVEVIQAGAIGPVHEIHIWTNRPIWPQAPTIMDRPMEAQPVPGNLHWEEWLGPAPFRPYHSVYEPFKWRGWWDFGTGALGDMGCHTANLAFMAAKLNEVYPTSLYGESGVLSPETYPSWATVTYEFPARGDMPPLKAIWYEGHKIENGRKTHNWPPRELFHGQTVVDSGALMVGDKGILYSPNDYGANYKLLPEDQFRDYKKPAPTLPRNGQGDLGMKKEWVAAIKGGPPAMSNFNYSARLTEFILLGNVAIRAGFRKLQWDGENLKVANMPEANQFLLREYRKGYDQVAPDKI